MKSLLATTLLTGAITAVMSLGSAEAGPIPPGWTCVGNCGTEAADGVVTLSPFGSPTYMWTSTALGVDGEGQAGGAGGTNGSILTSPLFAANAGDVLSFYFNYVTSDGAGYSDYAWAMLLDDTLASATTLFTARTTPSGDTVPGFGLPPLAPGVTLSPASTPIIAGGPVWSPLGGSSGECFADGCGYTGWIQMNYTIPTAGDYYLRIGVTNIIDNGWDSGMAMDGAQIDGQVIGDDAVPAPAALALFGLGLVGLSVLRRRRRAI
jgi:hypothetical protein